MKTSSYVFLCMLIVLMAGCCDMSVSGCWQRPPIVMESDFQRKTITPCDNDMFCFRHVYDVTWDDECRVEKNSLSPLCGVQSWGYPVSYRSNEYVFETGSYGYAITLPAGGAVKMNHE